MAGPADQLFDLAKQTIQNQENDVSEAVGLAQKMQAVQAQRAQVEQAKKDLQEKKVGKLSDTILKGLDIKDQKSRSMFLNNFVPKQRDALGLGEIFSDDILKFVASSDANLLNFKTLVSKVQKGEMPFDAAVGIMQDPAKFVEYQPSQADLNELLEAEKGAETRKFERAKNVFIQNEQDKRQADKISATAAAAEKTRQEAGNVQLRKKVATDFATFSSGGGLSGIQDKLGKLKSTLADMKAGKIKTGGFKGFVKSIAGEKPTALVDPKLKAAMDDVRGAISIKGQLDSQFSAKEAEIQFGRAFDPGLPTAENVKKIENMIKQIEGDVRNKSVQFKKEGFDLGKGTVPVADSDPIIGQAKKLFSGLPADKKPLFVRQLAAKLKKTEAEILKMLGVK